MGEEGGLPFSVLGRCLGMGDRFFTARVCSGHCGRQAYHALNAGSSPGSL